MPEMQFPRILAFVEGMMERKFFNENFHYVHVVPIDNGSSWTVDAICKQIGSKFSALNMTSEKIVVWIDKEKQPCGDDVFREKITQALVSRGARGESISVCIPNQMTENLILADEKTISKEFELSNYQYCGDGGNGKSILRQLFFAKGKKYRETIDGAKLLAKIRMMRSAAKCDAAAVFLEKLGLNDCWWIDDITADDVKVDDTILPLAGEG